MFSISLSLFSKKSFWIIVACIGAILFSLTLGIWYVRHIRMDRLKQQARINQLEQALRNAQSAAAQGTQEAERVAKMHQELEALKKAQPKKAQANTAKNNKTLIAQKTARADGLAVPEAIEQASSAALDAADGDRKISELEGALDELLKYPEGPLNGEMPTQVGDELRMQHEQEPNEAAHATDRATDSQAQQSYAAPQVDRGGRRRGVNHAAAARREAALHNFQRRHIEAQAQELDEESRKAISDAVKNCLAGLIQ